MTKVTRAKKYLNFLQNSRSDFLKKVKLPAEKKTFSTGTVVMNDNAYFTPTTRQFGSGLEHVRLIAVGLPAGVGVRARAQSLIVIVTQWHPRITQPMLSSYSESTDVERD